MSHLSADDLAAYVGVKPSVVRKWIKRMGLPAALLPSPDNSGWNYVVEEDDFDTWAADHLPHVPRAS